MDELERQVRIVLFAQEDIKRITPDCTIGLHIIDRKPDKNCKTCGISLCQHYNYKLCGCMQVRGHVGLHYNPYDTIGSSWTDSAGMYVTSHADWIKLLKIRFPSTNWDKE